MMLRRVARPLLASIFVFSGIYDLRHRQATAEAFKPLVDKTVGSRTEQLPERMPTDPVTYAEINGVVKTVGGALFALGILPRISSLLLFATLVPNTIAAHPFWQEEDSEQRMQQLVHFLKNAGLGGGLLLAVADTEGRPSVGWRARRAVSEAGHQVHGTAGTLQHTVGKATGKAEKFAGKAAGRTAGKAAKRTGKAGKAAGRATMMTEKATGKAAMMADRATGKVEQVAGKTVKMTDKAAKKAAKAAEKVRKSGSRTAKATDKAARKTARKTAKVADKGARKATVQARYGVPQVMLRPGRSR